MSAQTEASVQRVAEAVTTLALLPPLSADQEAALATVNAYALRATTLMKKLAAAEAEVERVTRHWNAEVAEVVRLREYIEQHGCHIFVVGHDGVCDSCGHMRDTSVHISAPAVSDKAAWIAAHRDELQPVTVSSPEPSRVVEEQPDGTTGLNATNIADRPMPSNESVPASSVSAERAALIADLEAWQFAREADDNANRHDAARQAGTRLLAQAVAALRGEA